MNQHAHQNATENDDLTIHDLLNLPEDRRRVLNWMQRQTVCSLQSVVDFLNETEEQVDSLLQDLQQQGFVQAIATGQETLYQVRLNSMRHKRHQVDPPSIFDLLMDDNE